MTTLNIADFKFKAGGEFSKFPTKIDFKQTEDELKKGFKATRKELSGLQDKMYAHNKYSVLICLQGMDTSGKDGLIREVFKEFNARGVVVHSFKTPNSSELEHDYLWRHYIALPEKGKFAVFNRTHYENVLVTRVHPEYILNENLPGIETVSDIPVDFWDKRYDQIVNFENHLVENGTIILKFFLNLSKEEQRQRLLRRLEMPKHNWKFSPGDLKERKLWDKYYAYYEEAIVKTATDKAPWFVVPADDKELARYIVLQAIYEELAEYTDIQFPELDDRVQENLSFYRNELENEQ